MTGRGTKRGLWVTDVLEGMPLQVAGRELVPLVRVTSRTRRGASLYGGGVGGQGYGIVHLKPVVILDRGESGRFAPECVRIRNETARAIGWLLLIALLIPWLATLLVYLARIVDSRLSEPGSA